MRELREAAAVILLRRGVSGEAPFEVFLLRRRKGASFMAQAHVFPGGGCDPGEDARAAAVRELHEEAGVVVDAAALVPWAWWVTPSIEPRRFSARFFAAELPAGATPKFDGVETVDQVWIAPCDAPALSGQLRLPPPQLRTCWELAQHASLDAVLAARRDQQPVLPRLWAAGGGGVTLVLPWDAAYAESTGEAMANDCRPGGPSRYLMTPDGWVGQ